MSERVRVNLELPPEALAWLDRLATDRRETRTSVIRQAISLYGLVNTSLREGRHVGIADSPDAFRTVISLPL